MAYKTKYIVINNMKYIGNDKELTCRSLWERRFCKYLDTNTRVIKWGFECLRIPYTSPVDRKTHHYIPDFIVEAVDNNNKKSITMIEIKPQKQTKDPNSRKRIKLEEAITYSINEAKWNSAKDFCKNNGWSFKILTEKELFS
jgi:hypothetical protein